LNNSKSRQLLLSIAVISLMLTMTLLAPSANATSAGGTIQKSVTMTAGSDGRSFAAVNGTWSLPSVQTVDYNHPFQIYSIGYTDTSPATTATYTLPGPKVESPPTGYNPSWFNGYAGQLGPGFSVPTFLMTHNTTNNIVSPTITLSSRNNITLGIGVTSEIQVDAMNPVVAVLGVSADAVGTLAAYTGLVVGGNVHMYVSDPYGNFIDGGTLSAGYFAEPMLIYAAGYYMIYFTSATSSYVSMTPVIVSATSTAMGQFASGEMNIPEQLTQDALISGEPQPSKIVALSYDVSKGDEYAFSFTANEHLSGPPGPSSSDYICYYFDVGTNVYGMSRTGSLGYTGSGTLQPVVSKAVVSGKVYVVLVGNYISRFQYSMGVESTTIPTAPLNTPWLLTLPTPLLMTSQLYHFSLSNESMVKMNYSSYAGGTMRAEIFKITPTGTVYTTGEYNLGAGFFYTGAAENNFNYALHLGIGDYMVKFRASSGTPSANLEINAYPISNYTSGDAFNLQVGASIALAFNITSAFEYRAFNVTLLSHLNASMNYRISLFDDYGRYLNTYYADGNTARRGLGNRQSSGTWQGVSNGQYYVDPSTTQKYFNGNKTAQQCQFFSTYAGRYFLIVDFRYGYNTTTSGLSDLNRWRFYPGLTASLKIDVSQPDLVSQGFYEIKYVTLDSSAGTAGTSVTFTGAGATTRLVGLKLTPKINAWTRISVSILNGTRNTYDRLYDKIRYQSIETFDYSESLGLWSPYKQVTNSYGFVNTTYTIEFGTFTSAMFVLFYINLPGGASHTVVSMNVQHFNATGISGLTPPTGAPPTGPSAPFPIEIAVVVIVIVVVALVVVFIVVKKRSK
jgi:hypothetical protein